MIEQSGNQSPSADVNRENLRQSLLQKITNATECLEQSARQFDAEDASIEERSQFNEKVIQMLEHVLDAAKPQEKESLFIRNLVKPFHKYHQEAITLREELASERSSQGYTRRLLSDNEALVFVSLYQLDGYDLSRWQNQIQDLLRFNVARPVYSDEKAINKVIRAKTSRTSEGYLVVAIDKSGIIPSDDVEVSDIEQGPEASLIRLSETAIKRGELLEFIHLSRHYRVEDKKLILINTVGE